MDRYEESIFGDLADEADDSWDEIDEADAGDEADDAWDEYDEGDAGDEADSAEDEYESPVNWEGADEGEDAYDERSDDAESSLEDVVAHALGAEDTDEFFGKIFKAVKKAAPTIGKIARAVAPVASMIPGYGTAIGGVANVIGELLADEASEDEALDAFAEAAVHNKAARPVVAGLVARKVLGPKVAQMPLSVRRAAVHTINRAAKQLVAAGGPAAIRALPRLARSVKRTAVARHTPPAARTRVLVNAARRLVNQHPQLKRQLTRPSRLGQSVLRRAGSGYGVGRGRGGRTRRGWGWGGGSGRNWGWGGGSTGRGGYGGYGGGSPGRGTYGGWGPAPSYGPWGGYTDYPTGDDGGSDYRKIRTRGPVEISIRPRS
jgi:hypothetical protein